MEKLKQLIEKSTSSFHLVQAVKEELDREGFKEYTLKQKWDIQKGDKFYVSLYSSSLYAFHIGHIEDENSNLRIASAHTDFPCLKIKPAGEITENGFHKLNVEVYGGPILNTWLDRPLSISGKVSLKGSNAFAPEIRLIDFNRPVLIIPNLAVHLNKDVNKGIELNKQKDMLPIADIVQEEINPTFLVQQIARELSVEENSILDYELFVYQIEKGEQIGFDNTMYSSPRLDNITSVRACIDGLLRGSRNKGINAVALFDHEEIGSRSNKGAASNLFSLVLEKVYYSLYQSKENYINDLANGFLISADVAHAHHPNSPEKGDITNKVALNKGVVLKYAAAQSYANDCESCSVIIGLCKENNIPYQKYVNRSDGTFGSTLGSIISTTLPIRTIDLGVPILAMHSARELMGIQDQENITKLITAFFS